MHYDFYDLKIDIKYYITAFCFWVIKKINYSKDRNLSQRLFIAAEDYNCRPGTNNYFTHDGRDCQEIDVALEISKRDNI